MTVARRRAGFLLKGPIQRGDGGGHWDDLRTLDASELPLGYARARDKLPKRDAQECSKETNYVAHVAPDSVTGAAQWERGQKSVKR